MLVASVATAQPAMLAGDYVILTQYIEGWRLERLAWGTANAQPLTIGFWSDHSRIGLYAGTVKNSDGTRSCGFTYTQAVADTPQFNTVTIPGCTDGVWNKDANVGLRLGFAQACGSTFSAPAALTWYNVNYLSVTGAVNNVTTTSDVFRLTGVVVLPGNEAPLAARAPFIMRPYDQELIVAKRYWQKFPSIIVDVGTAAHALIFPVEMRIAPTIAGGGAGFGSSATDTLHIVPFQTTRALQSLTVDARLP